MLSYVGVSSLGVRLDGVSVRDENGDSQSENLADAVLKKVRNKLGKLNGKLRARQPRRT